MRMTADILRDCRDLLEDRDEFIMLVKKTVREGRQDVTRIVGRRPSREVNSREVHWTDLAEERYVKKKEKEKRP